ncbi:hypothetical protein HY408_01100 [Candidatus Gottesmanbacteria bacterium]|nr:hypothetical protein [Candidatus Gottesmanbacteria bacterium]
MSSDIRYEPVRATLKAKGVAFATLMVDVGACNTTPDYSLCLDDTMKNWQTWVNETGIGAAIIRVYNGGYEISSSKAFTLGDAFARYFPGRRVVFGNEPNNIVLEWKGGTPASYAESLKQFADGAKGRIEVIAAPLDPFFEDTVSGFKAEDFIRQVYGGGNALKFINVDGLAFNVYHEGSDIGDCPIEVTALTSALRRTKCSWLWLVGIYGGNGVKQKKFYLTEFSLAPHTSDDDLGSVINFIDTNKQEMIDRGAELITPLIRNPCFDPSATSGFKKWPWLMFLDGSPSQAVNPENGEAVSETCVEADFVECQEVEDSEPQKRGIFNFLKSFFGAIYSSIHGLFAQKTGECTNAFDVIGSDVEDDRRTAAGKRFCNYDPKTVGTISYPYNVSENVTISFNLFNEISRLFSWNVSTNAWLPFYNTSKKYSPGQVPSENTAVDYYAGCSDTEYLEDWNKYKNAKPEDKDKEFLKKARKCAGVIIKSLPYKTKNANKEYKKTDDALRDKTLMAIAHNYVCDHPNFGGVCGAVDHFREFDYRLGWVTPVDPNAADITTTATLYNSSEPPTSKKREMWVSELFCINPNFVTPFVGRNEINTVCQEIMGPNYASGEIAANSIIGKANNGRNLFKTPDESQIYSWSVAWEKVPNKPLYDTEAAGSLDRIFPGQGDDNKHSPPPDAKDYDADAGSYMMPGVTGVNEMAKIGANLKLPKDNGKNREKYELPKIDCPGNSVGDDKVLDAVAGMEYNRSFPAFNIFNLLGIFGIGDQKTDSRTMSRDGTIELAISQNQADNVLYARSIGNARQPLSTVKKLRTKVGGPDGPTIDALGTPSEFRCTGANCPNKGTIPLTGGPAILAYNPEPCGSLLQESLRPRKACKKSISGWVHDVASQVEVDRLSKNAWESLVSLNPLKRTNDNLSTHEVVSPVD